MAISFCGGVTGPAGRAGDDDDDDDNDDDNDGDDGDDRTKSSTNCILENGVFALAMTNMCILPEASFAASLLFLTYKFSIRCRMPLRNSMSHLPITNTLPC